MFQPYFHETGFVVSASTPELIEHIKKDGIDSSEGDFASLETAEYFRSTMPPGVLMSSAGGLKRQWTETGILRKVGLEGLMKSWTLGM